MRHHHHHNVEPQFTFTGSILLLCLITLFVHYLFSTHAPHPYMDETFHVPQMRRYLACAAGTAHENNPAACLVDTEWDPKITTPPGLYWLTWPYCAFIRAAHPSTTTTTTTCTESVPVLRFFNVLLFMVYVLLLRGGLFSSTAASGARTSSFGASRLLAHLQMLLFPLVYFSVFLYYTDFISLLAFLCMLHFESPLFALLCVMCRQSNIVWVFFMGVVVVLKSFLASPPKHRRLLATSPPVNSLIQFTLYCLTNLPLIIRVYFKWILIGILFVIFVLLNGSIVLGDKSNHKATLHVPQFFYFCAFACAMLPGHLICVLMHLPTQFRARYFTAEKSPHRTHQDHRHDTKTLNLTQILFDTVFFSLACCVVALLSYKFAFVHPFILSDNRHYIFYLWRRIFKVHNVHSEEYRVRNALLAPVYVVSALMLNSLLRYKHAIWKTIYWLCVALSLVPTPLVEFRYFIIPFYLLLESIEVPVRKWEPFARAINVLWYIAINFFTLHMFLFRPFGAQLESRFMW
mmetsp:Transcript_2906/g.11081  ORF Transcript_2906/g.11081 Transcript_2906/m.11081 type:complete len:517 (-) Transcript_2906:317-1867(-)